MYQPSKNYIPEDLNIWEADEGEAMGQFESTKKSYQNLADIDKEYTHMTKTLTCKNKDNKL